MRDAPALHPEAAGAARIVAGHHVHALPDEFRDEQTLAHTLQHGVKRVARLRGARHEAHIARGACRRHAEFPRRVAAEHIALHAPALHDAARRKADALAVKGRGAEGARHQRVRRNVQMRRQRLFAQTVLQETHAPVQRPAAQRAQHDAQQPQRQRRFKQHRALARRQGARPKAAQRTRCRCVPHIFGRGKLRGVARLRHPPVALHAAGVLRNRRHRQPVRRRSKAATKTVRVRGKKVPLPRPHARPLAVGNARVHVIRRALGAQRQFQRLRAVNRPRVEQIQIGLRIGLRHQRLIGQPGGGVRLGKARDVARRLHRTLQRGG